MSEHTPGPWSRTDERPARPYFVAQVCPTHMPWAYVAAGNPTGGSGWPVVDMDTMPVMRANARLIAAAPDLLAACKSVLERMCNGCAFVSDLACAGRCDDGEKHDELSRAIRRAEGGGACP